MITFPSKKDIALIIPCSEPNGIIERKCNIGRVRDQASNDFREMDLSIRKYGEKII